MTYPKTKQIKEERRKRAEERNAEYQKLTIEEKIAKLPSIGAGKQRAKLTKLLEKQKN